MIYRFTGSLCACALLVAGSAGAGTLPEADGEVLLTVTGQIAHTNAGEAARFDRDMLAEMDRETVKTGTVWTEGVEKFEGVPLRELLERLGAEGKTVRAYAANDYAIEIPMDTIEADVPIVADLRNGKEMSLRYNGPLWIIYPFDSDERYQSEVIYSRSIWQLNRLEILE